MKVLAKQDNESAMILLGSVPLEGFTGADKSYTCNWSRL